MTRLLHQWPAAQAERRPDAGALVLGETRVSYGELEAASNRLARLLGAVGCRPGERVALLLPKSPTAVISLLGVLKAGGIYVPVDPANPAARVAAIFASCEPRIVLVAGAAARSLAELSVAGRPAPRYRIGCMDERSACDLPVRPDFVLSDLAAFPARPRDPPPAACAAAHILFTSGSTGVPKGVVIRHSGVIRFVEWANGYFGPTPGDRHSGHSPLHFDLSTYDVFGTLAAGAELHLVPPEVNLLPHKLAQFVRASRLTQWFSVPSVLTHMAKSGAVGHGDFATLRRVLWCGEAFPTPALRHWMQRVPHASFTNLYGPTETTIASSYYTMPACPVDDGASVPIGHPCAGEVLRVLDEAGEPVPPGEIGELYIGGEGVSAGYWRDPERTRAAFGRAPGGKPGGRLYRTGDLASVSPDGLTFFHGRADTQIKARGYRIELGEIEGALLALDEIAEGAVVGVPTDGFAGTTICCAYVPAGRARGAVTPGELRRRLAARLPPYMLPARWLALDRLPRNANGKIGLRELRDAFLGHEAVAH